MAVRHGTQRGHQVPPAVSDGIVYVGSDDTRLYALDAGSGEEKWRFQCDDYVDSSPAVVDGTVYVGSWTTVSMR